VRTLLVVMVPCLLVLPLILYMVLTSSTIGNRGSIDSADTARRVLGLIDFDHLSGPEIKGRIEELLRIKDSVQGELRSMEQRRAAMQSEIQELGSKIEQLRMEGSRETKELERLRVSIQQVKVQQQEYIQRNTPDIAPPLPLLPDRLAGPPPPQSNTPCSLSSCFDFSRCSVSSGMPVYVYPDSREGVTTPHLTTKPSTACLYLARLGPTTTLPTLQYWAGDGRNHLVLVPHSQGHAQDTGRAIIVSSTARRGVFRPGYDLVLPDMDTVEDQEPPWARYPLLVPVVREFLIVFDGQQKMESKVALALDEVVRQDRQVVATLQDMKTKGTSDKFLLSFSCESFDQSIPVETTDWALCGTSHTRNTRLVRATFCLILQPSDRLVISSPAIQARLVECLQAGSIPVILSQDIVLPLAEVVDWSKAAIILPVQRVTELHYLLRTLPHSDIFSLKKQGRLILETYLSSYKTMVQAMLGVLRHRLTIPALPFQDTPSPSVFNKTFTPLLMDHLPADVEPDESLGPLEPPFPSPAFKRNYSTILAHSSHSWNTVFSTNLAAPHTPWEPVLPTEAKFHGSGLGFRPICGGEGGAGREFSQALGGNTPQEQFTVVMLTYEREQVLMNSLARLYGLPYLNKVVVVWNSPRPPASDLQWPDIGVPIHVVRTEKNSLNNRFLPFSAIETEAVLSVDDDAHLRHDEIIFGFRVWREHRDRLVGFPGRFHAWDLENNSWNYNSNYSCELSMVLTGAAFYHKYYSYVYSEVMAPAIRDMVDDFMNCEDLAMNFLISHITRQPPVKVTSRWTFRCPGCPVSLSEDDSHFQERHKCINFFSRVYGYMPLLYTQFRADSVLFKTRIPPDKQKCFKFI